MQRQKPNGRWVNLARWPNASKVFAPDGTRHALKLVRDYQYNTKQSPFAGQRHRLVFQLRAMDGSSVVYSKVLTVVCNLQPN